MLLLHMRLMEECGTMQEGTDMDDSGRNMLPHSLVNRSTFNRNLKTERSVATGEGNALVFQACITQLARKTDEVFHERATCPHAKDGPCFAFIEYDG